MVVYILSLCGCLFWTFSVNGIIQPVRVFLCLVSLIWHCISRFHQCHTLCQSFIPFHCQTVFHWRDRSHFNLLMNMSCFHFLDLTKNASIKFSYKFFCGHMFPFLLGICLEVWFLEHVVTLYLTFLGASKLFSQVATPLYIPTSSVGGF